MSEVKASQRVSALEKVSYGLGDTASNIVFQTVMLLMPYFYTDVFGLSAASMGTMFLFVRVTDAILLSCDHDTPPTLTRGPPYFLSASLCCALPRPVPCVCSVCVLSCC